MPHPTTTLTNLPAIAGGVPVRPPGRPLIFGAPIIGEAEISSLLECLHSRWIGPGERVERFEQEFARYKGAPYAAAVSSGTAAIHLALVALGIGPGDEVVAPTMTFCSTIHSIVHAGATPVLVDCRRTTLNMHPDELERRITPRTKAILVVHMCGACCEMDAILDIARRHQLRVIEDCAHAIEANYSGQPAGLIGDVGCFSFYPTKSITTGDGGMVITRDGQLCRRIKVLSLHGMTADAWTRSVRGWSGYDVIDVGFKYNMTDLGAALGLAQLVEVDRRWAQREKIWHTYNSCLRELPVVLPTLTQQNTHAYHLYTPLLNLEELAVGQEQIITALRMENIGVGIHYVPVHRHSYYRRRFRYRPSDFPNADFVGERTLSLPLSPDLSAEDVKDVCTALTRVLYHYASSRLNSV
jgi:dTDP-4-amino-4,6-dideoxygalactose transaminase